MRLLVGTRIFTTIRKSLYGVGMAALLFGGGVVNSMAQSAMSGTCEDPQDADASAFAEALKLDTRAAYDQYLLLHPLGCYLERANQLRIEREDDEAWARARTENTTAAYQIYLDRYPDGRYTARAFEAIRALSRTASPAPDPAPARQLNRYSGVELKGSIVGSSLAADANSCASDCGSNVQCVAYTLKTDTGLCLFLSSVESGMIDPGFHSGSSVDVPLIQAKPAETVEQPQAPQSPAATFSTLNATDIPGYDLEILRDISVIDCQRACTDNRSCGAYTYNIPNNVCFLKTGVGNTEFNPDAYSAQRR